MNKLNKNRLGYKKTKVGWMTCEFEEIVSLRKEKINPTEYAENLKCIELEHLEKETGRLLGYVEISQQKSLKSRFYSEDVLFGKLRPYLCKYYFCNFDGACSSEIWVMKTFSKKCISFYLFYLIQTNSFIKHASVSSGSKMPRSDWNYLKNIPFDLPPLPEQKKIAKILSAWDRAIEQVGKLIETKETRYRGLLNDLINKASAKHRWKKVRLGELFKEVTEKIGERNIPPFSISAGIGFVSQKEKWGKDIAGKQYQNYVRLRKGEFAYNKGNSKKYKCGCAYLLKDHNEIAVPNVFISFRRKNKALCSEFYEHYFIADHPARELRKHITSSARSDGLLNLNKNNFFKILVPCPPTNRQKLIANVLTASQHEINILKKLADTYQKQKRGLMQKLLTGTIRVKE